MGTSNVIGALGSTAEIDDQSASNYVDIGNMRIQWGSQAQNSAGVIFPQAFGATPSVTASAGNTDAYIGVSGVSTTGFNWGAYNFNGAFSNATLFTWIAIGLKP